MAVHQYLYHFNLQDGTQKKIEVRLSEDKFEMIRQNQATPPDWTKLDENKCANCPLKSADVSHCPVAVNLSDLVDYFSEHVSYEKIEILVETSSRSYYKKTDLQDGIQSLYGLIMATSGCPHMNFLKPMAHFHLPFSQFEETITRTISIYLLQQHYLQEKGEITEVNLKTLEQCYAQVNQVNQGISNRFRQLKMKDSSKNGIIILDTFATMVPWELAGGFKKFESLFKCQNTHQLPKT